MSSDQNSFNKSVTRTNTTTLFSQARRKISLRRKKLPIVRLGGGAGGKKQRRRFSLVKIFRRVRLKWLKLQYIRMLKKVKEYYESSVKDIMEGHEAIDAFQRRLLFETSFAVPVMGLSFNTFPNHRGT
ncbi:hypothetical protein RND71_017006 [Anisodus tanguticus]|uniref:Uncharacterized protein n=1 Tax=Anisodus tanguticus TaxID=243964 RepID=A0AAE1VIQ3_9SOLA|nr:hypothetical protein RND71_017006 [Anisodus tanguticus]